MNSVGFLANFLRARWKSFRYIRDPRGFWEQRGAKDDFEKYPAGIYAEQVDFLSRKISSLGAGSALEIGCGYGRILRVARNSVEDPGLVVGVDFGHPQLEKAKAFLGNHSPCLIQATASDLPFKDRSFELVYSIGVLMHIPPASIHKALSEVIRVSRRYVLFSEGIYKHFNMFGLDFRRQFGSLGLRTLECVHDPYRVLRPKPMQFAIMEKAEPTQGRK